MSCCSWLTHVRLPPCSSRSTLPTLLGWEAALLEKTLSQYVSILGLYNFAYQRYTTIVTVENIHVLNILGKSEVFDYHPHSLTIHPSTLSPFQPSHPLTSLPLIPSPPHPLPSHPPTLSPFHHLTVSSFHLLHSTTWTTPLVYISLTAGHTMRLSSWSEWTPVAKLQWKTLWVGRSSQDIWPRKVLKCMKYTLWVGRHGPNCHV